MDELELTARARKILNRRPAVGFVLGVVRDRSLRFVHPHGVADVATRTPVSQDTVFRVASITKTFTAIAVMQLCEVGLIDLDAPANDYLRGYRLVPRRTTWRPATVRHLLTHTAGIAEQVPRLGMLRPDFGESVPEGRRVPSPAEYYRGRLHVDAEPGTRFRYGDHGFATLGQIVEDVTGSPLDRYLRDHVFRPLGMTATTLVRNQVDPARLATGYTLGRHGPRAVPVREWVTVGATNAYSTLTDMARYVAALLGRGGNEHGSVLEPATLATMFAPQYQPDPRIPGMGLGFWRRETGGHPVVEHLGLLPGFDSQIVLAPDEGVGVLAFTNGTRNGALWLSTELAGLLGELLGVPDPMIRTDIPQRPESWDALCGPYYLPGPLTDVRVRAFVGAGVAVFVRDGRLHLRFLTPVPALAKGFPLHPDDEADPRSFTIDLSEFGFGNFPVRFGVDPATGAAAVHFEVMPLSAHQRSRRRKDGARSSSTTRSSRPGLVRDLGP